MWPYAKLIEYRLNIHWLFFEAVFKGNFFSYQLRHVFIACRNQHLLSFSFSTFG
ncbi:Uncharacterised protein [Mycobacteroides abscessus subsp. abscessus]|nr:Uncharacterised protein [Mycobacteroides abscessus subsp. abscessus]